MTGGQVDSQKAKPEKEGLSAKTSDTIYVINTNDAPETVLKSKKVIYGAANYVIEGVDDFDQTLDFYASMTGSNISFNYSKVNSTGTFNIFPLKDGQYIFSCYAKDKAGLSDPTPYIDTINCNGLHS